MNNLELYSKVRKVPQEALKPIMAGRLKGKSDINPMWRIKTLTEQFGVVGIGWYYDILEERIEEGANNEKCALIKIALYINVNGEWSKPIQGTGGSSFVANEKNGLYTNDECFKMALTDAISVCCKMLGIGADVYWDKDKSKYQAPQPIQAKQVPQPIQTKQAPKQQYERINEAQQQALIDLGKDGNVEICKRIIKKYNYVQSKDISVHDFNKIYDEIKKEIDKRP
jgi:hypothetical protein